MPSKDTISYRLLKNTKKELDKWIEKFVQILGVNPKDVNYKHAEIALRISATRGNVKIKEMQDILLGKIR